MRRAILDYYALAPSQTPTTGLHSPAFIALFSDNPALLTGCSYYALYEMLKAVYEILLPVEGMMELKLAVIHNFIIAPVGKYTVA